MLPLSSASSSARVSSHRLGLVEALLVAVDVRQVVERLGLEILAPEPLRDLERLLGRLLLGVEVADRTRRCCARTSSAVKRPSAGRASSAASISSVAFGRFAVAQQRDLGERGERLALDRAVAGRARLVEHLAPSRPRPPAGRSGATPRAPRGSGARAWARARPRAGAACGRSGTTRGRARGGPPPRARRRPRWRARPAAAPSSSASSCVAWSRW